MADDSVKLDFSFFTSDNVADVKISDTDDTKKKSRKSRVQQVEPGGPDVTVQGNNNYAEVDYGRTYAETANMLRGAIMQADQMSSEIKQDIDSVRSSKTLKNKYTYITDLTSSAGSLLSTKIQAIRELNSSITQTHNLELNRAKALKLDQNTQNDEMRMMDIYSAFINTPVGTYTPQAPSLTELNLGANSSNPTVNAIEMNANIPNENLSPEQIRMRMESNPNIQVVVRYNQSTGQRFFDVLDRNTGESVPNYPRPDSFLLEDTTIDLNSGIARNRNINSVWPLVLDGNNKINEY